VASRRRKGWSDGDQTFRLSVVGFGRFVGLWVVGCRLSGCRLVRFGSSYRFRHRAGQRLVVRATADWCGCGGLGVDFATGGTEGAGSVVGWWVGSSLSSVCGFSAAAGPGCWFRQNPLLRPFWSSDKVSVD